MFTGLWNKVLRKDPIASCSYSNNIINKDIKSSLETLLFNPYILPQKECLKYIENIDLKIHKYHKKYKNSKCLKVLDSISKGDFKYGRSAPERFVEEMLKMITKKNVDVILGKKIMNYETDIYVDKLNCVFEIQGFNWHYENSKKILDDSKRAQKILSKVDDLFFITPIKGKSMSKTNHRFELFVYLFPQVISNIKSVDGYHNFVKPFFNSNIKDCIMIQNIILEMRKLLSDNPEFEF